VRCEIQFDRYSTKPLVSRTQSSEIRPREYLLDILTPGLREHGASTDARVRQAHLDIKAVEGKGKGREEGGMKGDKEGEGGRVSRRRASRYRRGRLLTPLPSTNHTPDQGRFSANS